MQHVRVLWELDSAGGRGDDDIAPVLAGQPQLPPPLLLYGIIRQVVIGSILRATGSGLGGFPVRPPLAKALDQGRFKMGLTGLERRKEVEGLGAKPLASCLRITAAKSCSRRTDSGLGFWAMSHLNSLARNTVSCSP